MDIKKIKELVEIAEQSSLSQLIVRDGDFELTLIKPDTIVKAIDVVQTDDNIEGNAEDIDDSIFITSPIVGTFYSAPAPDAPVHPHHPLKAGRGNLSLLYSDWIKTKNEKERLVR